MRKPDWSQSKSSWLVTDGIDANMLNQRFSIYCATSLVKLMYSTVFVPLALARPLGNCHIVFANPFCWKGFVTKYLYLASLDLNSLALSSRCTAAVQARTRGGQSGNCPSRYFQKRMYLLGAATSYIIPPPPKISVGCGPTAVYSEKLCTGRLGLLYIVQFCGISKPICSCHNFCSIKP